MMARTAATASRDSTIVAGMSHGLLSSCEGARCCEHLVVPVWLLRGHVSDWTWLEIEFAALDVAAPKAKSVNRHNHSGGKTHTAYRGSRAACTTRRHAMQPATHAHTCREAECVGER